MEWRREEEGTCCWVSFRRVALVSFHSSSITDLRLPFSSLSQIDATFFRPRQRSTSLHHSHHLTISLRSLPQLRPIPLPPTCLLLPTSISTSSFNSRFLSKLVHLRSLPLLPRNALCLRSLVVDNTSRSMVSERTLPSRSKLHSFKLPRTLILFRRSRTEQAGPRVGPWGGGKTPVAQRRVWRRRERSTWSSTVLDYLLIYLLDFGLFVLSPSLVALFLFIVLLCLYCFPSCASTFHLS